MAGDNKEEESECATEKSDFLPEVLKRGKHEELTWKDTLPQVMASCIALSVVVQAGANMAYSTVLMDGIKTGKNEPIQLTDNQATWIASLVTITVPIGSFLSGPLVDRFGRKTICIITTIPSIISWILLSSSTSLAPLYTARTLAGISAGLSTAGVIYVIEITHPKIRAMMLCLNSVFVSLGILLICCLALFLDWRKIAMVFIALNAGFLCLLLIIPESPYWLLCFGSHVTNDRRARAEKYLKWLNPRELIYTHEYSRIEEINEQKKTETSKKNNYITAIKSPTVYKPIILLFIILLVQQFSGCYVVIFYGISVFREIGGSFGSGLNAYGALFLLGVIRFFMSVVTAILSRTIGRRVLCIVSGLGMAFSMFFSAMFIYLTSYYEDNGAVKVMHEQQWVLLIIVLFYVCMSSLGFLVIPWTLIGELLPISFRGVGGGVMVSVAYVIMFGVTMAWEPALKFMGAQNIFFVFSLVSLLGTAVIYLFLPETLGKSFADIEKYFRECRINRRVRQGV